MENKILRIGNTILCNYAMVSNLGLQDGRMGVCLFLYEYARHSGIKEYEDMADDMIDPILNSLHKGQSEENISIVASIGIGVIYLITHNFLEDTDDSDALKEVDKLLLDTIETANSPSEMLMAASLYFIYRFANYRTNLNTTKSMVLAENIVRLYSKDTETDKHASLKSYIVRNAFNIIRLCKGEKSISSYDTFIPYEDSHDMTMTTKGKIQETLWYNFLFGTRKNITIEHILDIQGLSENCFYDPDRNVGILCAVGLTLIIKSKEE